MAAKNSAFCCPKHPSRRQESSPSALDREWQVPTILTVGRSHSARLPSASVCQLLRNTSTPRKASLRQPTVLFTSPNAKAKTGLRFIKRIWLTQVKTMKGARNEEKMRRILGRVPQDQFVGRTTELQQLMSYPTSSVEARALLLLLAPSAGVSELLRQAYDDLFNQRGNIIPIYFALPRDETTAVSTAIEFLNTFLLQYLAFRRDEPALCQSSVTLHDLLGLA